ncbi:DNA gyrase inhibitor YacG [Novosphingobium sp. 1949]|uniref:DNA gyrase inhibitor YacG n=1 Tax=Novosphingobium organovorum TaxID=2930092 RepID=A0ABT0BA21_9SPHN|nr:DNA gyrase inhibitor YacG [Novosphingobium organovorum]MCJ2181649.1 DNA gyrase inhibitor YacG [Novosphingobium organovorum]
MTHPKRKCPICGKSRQADHTPFCSKACRDRDLINWLDDGYALPGPPDLSSAEIEGFPNNPQDD